MPDARDDLDTATLLALAPRTAAERVRLLFSRGWTVLQVFERLPVASQVALNGNAEGDVVARRRGVEQLRQRLLVLAASGRVRRRTGHYSAELLSKGHRGVVVDLFSLA